MDETALVGDGTIAPHEHIVCDRLSENLDLEHICNDLLRLSVHIRVNQRDVVVTCDDIAQGRQSLLYSLNGDRIR